MVGKPAMSMEAALDEERLAVLELLESQAKAKRPHRGSTSSTGSGERIRASSPYTGSPRSPSKSMLNIAEEPANRHASIAGTNTGITAATRSQPVRSMLDIDSSPSSGALGSRSAQTSPTEGTHKGSGLNAAVMHPRSQSDASGKAKPRVDIKTGAYISDASYQFSGFLPSNPGGPVVPKRNTQGGKKTIGSPSMAAVLRGEELAPNLYGQRDRGRNSSIASALSGRDSRSPHNRIGLRSNSPSLNLSSSQYKLDSGAVVDMNSAYRRLSDANLALSGGSLASLANKGRGAHRGSGGLQDLLEGRLDNDYSYMEEEALAESSEDEGGSSDEERRGRKGGRGSDASKDAETEGTIGMGDAKGPGEPQSLMAAAEEERQEIARVQALQAKRGLLAGPYPPSMLDPQITVTNPSGSVVRNAGVHPTTAFDQGGASGNVSVVDSDEEREISDIRRAQKLAVIMTPIQSTPDSQRCVRTIYRGDFAQMQREAEDSLRRIRKYLVATDLSDEAQHALEWTIGTVLRDGDTLLAIYCVGEETGIVRPDDSPITSTAADREAITAQAVAAASATNKPSAASIAGATLHMPSPLALTSPRSARSTSRAATRSPSGRGRTNAEHERFKAVEDITERVAKLLRKTKLQVRVVIECIHCKSPKHLITEVIDFISPTLVILGSRGRSALKGVILGSFSNYLVTKSSVPVMVARKRLRKHAKYKRPSIRLTNNLTGVSAASLAAARID